MKTERFKIKNANSVEFELEVLTEDNVMNPDVPYSYPFKSIEYGHGNYRVINQILSDLISHGILVYDKQEGNEHVFKHIVDPNSSEVKYERISVGPETQYERRSEHEYVALPLKVDGARTLENMLYAVCQAHNIPTPNFIKPKNMFMTMYNRIMYPETPDAEIKSAVVTTVATLALGAAAAVYCRTSLANKFRS